MNRRACSTSAELNLRPIRRFTANTVFLGLVRAWRLAIWPTSRSPLAVNPTIEGVVRAPSWVGRTWGAPPSMTATQELVVPRSIPMTLPNRDLVDLAQASHLGMEAHAAPSVPSRRGNRLRPPPGPP